MSLFVAKMNEKRDKESLDEAHCCTSAGMSSKSNVSRHAKDSIVFYIIVKKNTNSKQNCSFAFILICSCFLPKNPRKILIKRHYASLESREPKRCSPSESHQDCIWQLWNVPPQTPHLPERWPLPRWRSKTRGETHPDEPTPGPYTWIQSYQSKLLTVVTFLIKRDSHVLNITFSTEWKS